MFKKDLDTVVESQLAFLSPSRVQRRGKQLHFIYEKEIHFKISLL
jgi:hypothetical protein